MRLWCGCGSAVIPAAMRLCFGCDPSLKQVDRRFLRGCDSAVLWLCYGDADAAVIRIWFVCDVAVIRLRSEPGTSGSVISPKLSRSWYGGIRLWFWTKRIGDMSEIEIDGSANSQNLKDMDQRILNDWNIWIGEFLTIGTSGSAISQNLKQDSGSTISQRLWFGGEWLWIDYDLATIRLCFRCDSAVIRLCFGCDAVAMWLWFEFHSDLVQL